MISGSGVLLRFMIPESIFDGFPLLVFGRDIQYLKRSYFCCGFTCLGRQELIAILFTFLLVYGRIVLYWYQMLKYVNFCGLDSVLCVIIVIRKLELVFLLIQDHRSLLRTLEQRILNLGAKHKKRSEEVDG